MAEKNALAPSTSLGPIPLLEGIALSVAAGREGWVTSFTRGGETIAEDRAAALPWIDPRAVSIYNQYTLICEDRDGLMQHLQAAGIGCAVYYPLPLHVQECFSELGYKAGDMPVSEALAGKVLSIPIYPELSTEQKDYICQSIRAFYQ